MNLNRSIKILMVSSSIALLGSCIDSNKEKSMDDYSKGTYGYDLNYLSKRDSLIILKSADNQSQVVVSPKYQAKVFTSTANGLDGQSLGWVNYKAFDATVLDEHMNAYGGEDRLWLGPEGGKYSIFFEPGAEQTFENWHTPKGIDTEPWSVVSSSANEVTMQKDLDLKNYLGTDLKIGIDRKIELMNKSEIEKNLGITLNDSIKSVAYSTENSLLNRNDFAWTPETGTVCIWMLDMYPTSDDSYTIIPFVEGDETELGRVVTSDYFGEIPADRLREKSGVLIFTADGKSRGKLGLNNKRTKPIAGNYDFAAKRLTITTFSVDENAIYLNQEWNPEKDPLKGDALNAYNDGPLADGSQMGPFLELESSSPAAFLKPGEKLNHKHVVYHFVGAESELNKISELLLGISLNNIKN